MAGKLTKFLSGNPAFDRWQDQVLAVVNPVLGVSVVPALIAAAVPDLSVVVDGAVLLRCKPGVAGRVLGCSFLATSVPTPAANVVYVTPQIDGRSVLGAVLTLSGATLALGGAVYSPAASGNSTFGTDSELTLLVTGAATAPYSAGSGQFFLSIVGR